MARRLHIAVSFVVLFIIVFITSPVHVAAEDAAQHCTELPRNFLVGRGYRAWIVDLVARSPTLRRQCMAIARHPGVRVELDSTRRLIGFDRARTSFVRVEDGTLWATVTIPMTRDFAELLAHELEHVVEQLEGVNLRQLAQLRGSGVREVSRNVYETTRALAAGRAAAGEANACRSAGAAACIAPVTTLLASAKD